MNLPFSVIQQLIELGADVSARDKVCQNSHCSLVCHFWSLQRKKNALHLAAQRSSTDKSVIDLLIEKDIDVTCQDMVTCFHYKMKNCKREIQDGKTPHQVASDGKIRALLRQHYVRHHFLI